MKISITGHSRGIGKSLHDMYVADGHEVIGFSRSNGYDITDPNVCSQIVQESLDCDLFVNNAYAKFSQELILEELYDLWKEKEDKSIVVINSRTRFGNARNAVYAATKKQLHKKTLRMLMDVEKRCRIISISPGYVKTDMTQTVHHKQYNMMTPDQLASMIKWCTDQPQNVEVGELSVWMTTLEDIKNI